MDQAQRDLTRCRSILVTCAGFVGWLLCVGGCESRPPVKEISVHPSNNTSAARELAVAAASDLRFVLGEIITAFETEHPEITVRPTFGSSGSLYSQIRNRAPFDLFLSADVEYPRKLIEQGNADGETLFSYAIGEIVIWAPKTSSLDVETRGTEVLLDASVQKIAIANPKHAPYGRAAESALKELGVYDKVADRLVLGDNIAQTAQFVESGAADVGIIAHSMALAPAMREKGKFWQIPASVYPPIQQAGVIVKAAKESQGAEEFRAFLMNERSRAIFQTHGFQLPTKE